MSFTNQFHNLSTEQLVETFKAAILQGEPPRELIDELARRPGIAFIKATDSTEVTLKKARAAIEQIEQGHQ